jgi:chromate reductase
MTKTLHVVGFAGSLRKQSFNRGLLRAAQELVPEGMDLEILELDDLPLYNQDLESAVPPGVHNFRQKIFEADAILLATPEYNYSVSGVLKNALDWASRPGGKGAILGKPAAIMGAGSRFGTVRAQLHLRHMLLYLDIPVVLKPEVMVDNAAQHFDATGNLTEERFRKQISELLHALVKLTHRY